MKITKLPAPVSKLLKPYSYGGNFSDSSYLVTACYTTGTSSEERYHELKRSCSTLNQVALTIERLYNVQMLNIYSLTVEKIHSTLLYRMQHDELENFIKQINGGDSDVIQIRI